jgi:Peptidase C10 family
MNKKFKIAVIAFLLLGFIYLCSCTSFLFFPDKSKCLKDRECLTNTHWKQMGGYEICTPDSLRTGCWSTALAQIVYYHKLKPFGHVEYISRQNYKINEDLDSSQFDFNLFTPSIDSTTSKETIKQLAKYNYYAALAVQKDFGTDRYMNKLASASLLEQHFKVKVERYIAWHKLLPNTLGKLEKVIYEEINAKRPIFLHFANLKDFGHSIVVDGYCYKNGRFMIHTNQGQGGPDDGWYDFHKGILKANDNALRVVYTFKPY